MIYSSADKRRRVWFQIVLLCFVRAIWLMLSAWQERPHINRVWFILHGSWGCISFSAFEMSSSYSSHALLAKTLAGRMLAAAEQEPATSTSKAESGPQLSTYTTSSSPTLPSPLIQTKLSVETCPPGMFPMGRQNLHWCSYAGTEAGPYLLPGDAHLVCRTSEP